MFEEMTHDLRSLLRVLKGKQENPTATVFGGRTLQSTPESVQAMTDTNASRGLKFI